MNNDCETISLKAVAQLFNLSVPIMRLFLKETKIISIGKSSAKEILYKASEIMTFKSQVEDRYVINKETVFSSLQLIKMGITTHDRFVLNKQRTTILDRYKDFKGTKYFFDKNEVNNRFTNKKNDLELMNLKEVKELLSISTEFQTLRVLKEYKIPQIKTTNINIKYFNKNEIEKLAIIIDQRYQFNKLNRLTNNQVLEMGLIRTDLIRLKTIKAEPIDRVKEFSGILALYDRNEAEEKLKDRQSKETELICEKDARNNLGFTNFNKFKQALADSNIERINAGKYQIIYYKKRDINRLKDTLLKRYQNNKETKLTGVQIIELGGTHYDIVSLKTIRTTCLDNIFEFSSVNAFYDKKEALLRIKNKVITEDVYTYEEVKGFFNKRKITDYLSNFGISPIIPNGSNAKYWSKKQIDSLLKEHTLSYAHYDKNYYSTSDIEKITGVSFPKITNIHTKIGIPLLTENIPKEAQLHRSAKSKKVLLKSQLQDITDVLKKYEIEVRNIQQKNEDLEIKQKIEEQKIKQKIEPKDELNIQLKTSLSNISKSQFRNLENEIINYLPTSINNKERLIILEIDLLNEIRISEQVWTKIKKSFSIQPITYGKVNYLVLEQVSPAISKLLNQQDQLLEQNYTYDEFLSLGYSTATASKINKVEIPEMFRFGKLVRKEVLFPKTQVQKLIKIRKKGEIIENYKMALEQTTLPNKLFIKAIKELNIKLPSSSSKTEDIWLKFISAKLLQCKGNSFTLKKSFVKYITVTEFLMENLLNSELFNLSSEEINFTFLNKMTPHNYQEVIYGFLKNMAANMDVKYNMYNIVNVHEQKRKRNAENPKTKASFSVEEFLTLLNFVTDISLHKKRAFEDRKRPLSNGAKYRNYESVWLYVILHLNNGWRSTDFVEKIPRITLPDTTQTYEEFANHDLTEDEAQLIVWELTSKLVNVQHNKNDKKSYFFCSDKLMLPLANALILCELKAIKTTPFSTNLIFLSTSNELTKTMRKIFFDKFPILGFNFKSLAANRSFITFVNTVIKQKTNRNPLEITKFIRNHSSIETTNGYIQLSEEHVNKISIEVFNKGYFGYTYEYLLKVVLEGENKDIVTKNIPHTLIKDVFGDIYKIENLATYFNSLGERNLSLYEYVDNLQHEQQKELINLIRLQQMPAKEEFWQCILGDCLYQEKNCDSCPFAIPHFYILTNTLNNLNSLIDQVENLDSIQLKGEKVRLVNLFYKNLIILSSAKKKFGEKVITAFLGKEYNLLLERISNLEGIYENLTIEG